MGGIGGEVLRVVLFAADRRAKAFVPRIRRLRSCLVPWFWAGLPWFWDEGNTWAPDELLLHWSGCVLWMASGLRARRVYRSGECRRAHVGGRHRGARWMRHGVGAVRGAPCFGDWAAQRTTQGQQRACLACEAHRQLSTPFAPQATPASITSTLRLGAGAALPTATLQ